MENSAIVVLKKNKIFAIVGICEKKVLFLRQYSYKRLFQTPKVN